MSPGRQEADLRVHVGPIHVDLAAVLVDDLADLADAALEHAVRRGIRHHQGGELVRMGLGLRLQVSDVNVAVGIGLDHDDAKASHHRARRIGAVGRLRNEADVAMSLVLRALIRADDQQAGELALGAGVGLERDRSESSDLGEPLLESLNSSVYPAACSAGRRGGSGRSPRRSPDTSRRSR
jgi:hypothetical protein